jgi:hypothetical protein
MAVGFRIDFLFYQVGHGDFLHSFFSTVSYHLEPNGWGTEYPYLLKQLYNGKLAWTNVPDVINELREIRSKLSKLKPNEVIWDFDDLNKRPPWGENISKDITDLSNYFVTSDGRDLFEVLFKALDDSVTEKTDIEIVSL